MMSRFKRSKKAKVWLEADEANTLTVEQVAQILGFQYEIQGKHIELENGIRGTQIENKPVWCDKDGTGIGDNLALAQLVTSRPFRECLELLLLDNAPLSVPSIKKDVKQPLTLPSNSYQEEGRQYLLERGISLEAIKTAEAQKMLRFAKDCVLFVGFEDGKPKSATRRGYAADDVAPRRDLSGSEKLYAPLLRGSSDKHIWIVEGGSDALALWTLYAKEDWPTVIVSGGANCRAFIEEPNINKLISHAERITIACENEKDQETQAKTDQQHAKQAELLRKYCSKVELWKPKNGVKDLADYLINKKEELCQ